MIDTIAQWLRTGAAKSWEKLADAIAKVEEYGEATEDTVRREAGIGKATELNQNMKNIWVTSTIVWLSQLYACCVCNFKGRYTNLILNPSVVEKLLPLLNLYLLSEGL